MRGEWCFPLRSVVSEGFTLISLLVNMLNKLQGGFLLEAPSPVAFALLKQRRSEAQDAAWMDSESDLEMQRKLSVDRAISCACLTCLRH